ncbi:O-antigen ligase family protein [Silvibacterium acidisoli]|uniref:O-antigen ligase family protein n=1 Tax=Acidobacteriaceae bacterium ZG23-2 TaxID=2883246 RepID=UPI00406C9DE9
MRRRAPVYLKVITWVLLFPMLYFGVRGMFSIDREASNNAAIDPSNATTPASDTMRLRLERAAAYGTFFAALVFAFPAVSRLARRNYILWTLPALALASTLWSQDRVKTASMAILATCLTAFSFYLVERFEPDELIELLNLVGMILTFSSYLIVALIPSAGIRFIDDSRAWQGIFVHKNYLGVSMVFFLAISYYARPRTAITRALRVFYQLSMLGLVVMSQSRTSWIELALLFLYLGFEHQYIQVGKNERALLLAAAAVIAVLTVSSLIYYASTVSVALGKSGDLTGRTVIFQALLPEIWKRPLEGFGYQAFFLGMHGESAHIVMTRGLKDVSNAENGVLQMWLELGLLGTGLMLFIIYRACRYAMASMAHRPSRSIRLACAMVFLAILGTMNGAKFMFPDSIDWMLFVVSYVQLAEHVRQPSMALARSRMLAWSY